MKVHKVSGCCASVRTENVPDILRWVPVESLDSRDVTGVKCPLMNRTKIDIYDMRYARGCRFVASKWSHWGNLENSYIVHNYMQEGYLQ